MQRKTDKPLGQRKTLTELAYERIKDDILSCVLVPGECISTAQIASGMQISPMPVRGALTRLESEGWVVVQPQRGVLVSTITAEELHENFIVRSRLEGLAANTACSHITEAEIIILRRLSEEMRQYSSVNSSRYFKANAQFHDTILRCSQNKTLIRLLTELRHQSMRSRVVTRHVPGHIIRRGAEHERIVEALAAKRGNLAETAMREHLLAAGAELVEFMLRQSANQLSKTETAEVSAITSAAAGLSIGEETTG